MNRIQRVATKYIASCGGGCEHPCQCGGECQCGGACKNKDKGSEPLQLRLDYPETSPALPRGLKASDRLSGYLSGFFQRYPRLQKLAPSSIRESDSIPGEARQKRGEILVSPKFWRVGLTTQDWILAHEIGHFFLEGSYPKFTEVAEDLGIDRWNIATFPYGQLNTEEAFADAFAGYFMEPSELGDRYPRWYQLVDRFVRKGRVAKDRSDKEKDEIYEEWKDLINMSEKELKSWAEDKDRLKASLSRDEAGDIQSGYDSLHRIKRRVDEPQKEWSDEDYDNAAQEIGFNSRMLGNEPGDVVSGTGMSKWEISLRNWGHDPSKKSSPAYSKWKSWKKKNKEEIKESKKEAAIHRVAWRWQNGC